MVKEMKREGEKKGKEGRKEERKRRKEERNNNREEKRKKRKEEIKIKSQSQICIEKSAEQVILLSSVGRACGC